MGSNNKNCKEKLCQIFVVWQQLPSVFLSVLTNNHKNTFITNYFIISSNPITKQHIANNIWSYQRWNTQILTEITPISILCILPNLNLLIVQNIHKNTCKTKHFITFKWFAKSPYFRETDHKKPYHIVLYPYFPNLTF